MTNHMLVVTVTYSTFLLAARCAICADNTAATQPAQSTPALTIQISEAGTQANETARTMLLSTGPQALKALNDTAQFISISSDMYEKLALVQSNPSASRNVRAKSSLNAIAFFKKYNAIEYLVSGLESDIPDVRRASAEAIFAVRENVERRRVQQLAPILKARIKLLTSREVSKSGEENVIDTDTAELLANTLKD